MTTPRLLDAIRQRRLLCDGAMGTQLFLRGLRSGSCGELWNLERPDDVAAIHRAYADAGADLITTNSFGATQIALERHGCADQADAVNRAAVEIARRATPAAIILGDVGPLGVLLEPYGDVTEEQADTAFRRQIASLSLADAILIETMVDPVEASIAIRAARSVAPTLPVIATFAFGARLRTMMGQTPEECVNAAAVAGASVIGANCGSGLSFDDYVSLARQLVEAAGEVPVIVQPNAGLPQDVDGRLVYSAQPDELARLASQLWSAGVRLIGGCCGTTPAHIAAMSACRNDSVISP